ncbi:ABC transporter ATP-binding protein [Bacillus carboniphilus]|uniref:ABC transporter ATP-binding protein n=1 Tax=Bacillus carboniphilus TaxID=86663 RepID=A0ABY9JV47_9BACI|nr:ABC transporter ATP-binding protein [Bacillus carboniphilus]WLR43282.1 ABC transporter ATP-binding protein [Bacillus carboniphilus]
MIHIDHVSKQFGKKSVLKEISCSVNQGEIFGLLGPSGSGKTTLVKLIMGMEKQDQGTIKIDGLTVPNLKISKTVGFMSQSDALYEDLTAFENLVFFASLYGMKRKHAKERISIVMDLVGLFNDIYTKVSAYSGGMKRRLSLAISLLHEPNILILDEPTVGIDPLMRKTIWEELNQLRKNGACILLTTHVMDEAEKCTKIAMLRDGHLLTVGTPEQIKQQEKVSSIEEAFLSLGGK